MLAFPAFAAIRAHHPDAHITLLTTRNYVGLASASPWFDAVAVDARPAWWNLSGLSRLRAQLSGFDFVYDLQTSARSSHYHRLAGMPGWSGIARGASHPDRDPARDRLHTRARQAGQLAQAGIGQGSALDPLKARLENPVDSNSWVSKGRLPFGGSGQSPAFPDPDLTWIAPHGPILPGRLALLAPGAAPHRPAKRWPAERFGALAVHLARIGFVPVVVGAATDRKLATLILRACPPALDLTGQTSMLELGGLAGRATLAVGNDTGPMHLAAAMGCPSLVLFSSESDPALTAPIGRTPGQVAILRVPALSELAVETVIAQVAARVATLAP